MEVKNYFMNISKISIKRAIGYLLIIVSQVVPVIVMCVELGFFLGVGCYILMLIMVFFLIWLLNYLFK
jgi:cytosine/uracil/thiamine/allantoin permease